MKFAKYKEKSRPLFLSLKILNIYELNTYLMALFMYSYFSDNLPSYFTNYFKLNEMIHSHNTRTASNIYIDYVRYWIPSNGIIIRSSKWLIIDCAVDTCRRH